jgi:DNA-binding FadR family transcriptional regulator
VRTPPPRDQRLHGKLAHDLGVAIVAGVHKPGDVLPGEIEHSQRLRVSRTAYREAVRILSAKGLVSSRPKTGTTVNPQSRWQVLDPQVLAWTFESEPSEAFVRDLFELRKMVEPAAAELAARRRLGTDLARMGYALEQMKRYGLAHPEGRAADQAFHHALLEAARNVPLLALSSSIEAAVLWTTVFKQRKRRLPRDPLPEHRAVYEAIVAGNAEQARDAMNELLRKALKDTELSMRE